MPFRVPVVEPMVNVSTTGAAAAMLMVALPFAAWGDMLSVLPSAQMTFRVPDAGTGLSCTSPVTRLRLNSRVVVPVCSLPPLDRMSMVPPSDVSSACGPNIPTEYWSRTVAFPPLTQPNTMSAPLIAIWGSMPSATHPVVVARMPNQTVSPTTVQDSVYSPSPSMVL